VVCTAGFPHSDIIGFAPAHGFPMLFAVCHVLLRLLTPRHPPFAFCSLSHVAETARSLIIFFFQDACVLLRIFFPLPIRFLRYLRPLLWSQMGLSRLELLTFPLSEGRSNHLSYRPHFTSLLTGCCLFCFIVCCRANLLCLLSEVL
jgi:hypothetical protein